jgi:hypothetical protein
MLRLPRRASSQLVAGIPFGQSGSINNLPVIRIGG